MIEILDSHSKKWDEYLLKMPVAYQDIYYQSRYYKLHEANNEGKAQCFIYIENNNIVMYPFLIREIIGYKLSKIYYDIESAYGYGGPISNTSNEEFLQRFEKTFIIYCENNNIVAEFIRFHPLLKNQEIFKQNINILENRKIIVSDLNKSIDTIWKCEITSKNRNMIRKAEKNNLKINFHKDMNIFKQIYFRTMNKVSAEQYYYFQDEYFKELEKNNDVFMMNVECEDKVIASALFMGHCNYIHYHLAGSVKEYLYLAPNNFLLWHAVKHAKSRGYKKLNLGGGLTKDLSDNLFRFKKGFSKDCDTFYIGKRIHNHKIYNYLINKWEKNTGKKSKLLLQYRYK